MILPILIAGFLAPQEPATADPAPIPVPAEEDIFYRLDAFTPPDGAVLEVGGMDYLRDGRLAVSTRRGQVWLVENSLADDPADARFSLFCEGLDEGLGLNVLDRFIYVIQRGELSRLVDADGDGRCDDVVCVSDEWGLSGNYHEFAYGLPEDADGNLYLSLNVSFFSPKWWLGQSTVPYRGWALKVDLNGKTTPIACGFRSPCGVSVDPNGELFITDNQGDWMPASPIFHVREGGFYGHPVSLNWTEEYRSTQTQASDTIPPARAATDREPAAVWLPYGWSRSPGNMVWDTTEGAFGPFSGQFFLAELTNGMILRGDFEEVDGVTQGWVIPFRRNVGSVVRLLLAEDGTLLCGLTNRGWGGLAPADGLARLRYSGKLPFEIRGVSLLGVDESHAAPGFAIELTKEPDPDWVARAVADPAQAFVLTRYDYDYWWEYGSPERSTTHPEATECSFENGVLRVRSAGLEPGYVVRVRLKGLTATDGSTLLHEEFAYTMNRIPGLPEGPPIARIVPPPPARETGEEGWLRLTYGDATDAWYHGGWELVEAELDPDDPTRFSTRPGNTHLTNTASPTPSNYVSKSVFGDAKIHIEFTLAEGTESALFVAGRYGLLLADGPRRSPATPDSTGTVLGTNGGPDVPPAQDAYRGAGERHGLDVEFVAPRFDAEGNKLSNARFVRVLMDDVLLHENLELPGPSASAPLKTEAATGPLVLLGTGGQLAIGNIRVRPQHVPRPEAGRDGYTALIDLAADDPLADWTITEEGYWYVEDEILIGEGPRSHLFSPRNDYADFDLHVEAKISDGGDSGIVLRAPMQPVGWPKGYVAEINSSFADTQKTGSLLGLAPVKTHLIAPDTWFDYDISCRTEEDGAAHIRIRVNGILVNDFIDPLGSHPVGHLAFKQHHDGSVVELRNLLIREP